MSHYRDELEAARLRIETLEARLVERDAVLAVRDAEIAERDAEIARLRTGGTGSSKASATGGVGPLVAGAVFAAIVLSLGALLLVAKRTPEYVAPAPVPPPPAEVTTTVDAPVATPTPTASAPPSRTSAISAVIQQARPEVRRCYERELKERPNAEGKIAVVIDIAATGRVSRVAINDASLRSPTFDACVRAAIERRVFPPDERGESTTVSVPFVFTSR